MKIATIVGVILIALGIFGYTAGGVSFTHEKKDVDLGPIQVSHRQTKTYAISPLVSTVLLIGGVGLVVVGFRKK